MQFSDEEIQHFIKKMEPKINKSLRQVKMNNQQDIRQSLHQIIIKKLKNNIIQEVPDFFNVIETGSKKTKKDIE